MRNTRRATCNDGLAQSCGTTCRRKTDRALSRRVILATVPVIATWKTTRLLDGSLYKVAEPIRCNGDPVKIIQVASTFERLFKVGWQRA